MSLPYHLTEPAYLLIYGASIYPRFTSFEPELDAERVMNVSARCTRLKVYGEDVTGIRILQAAYGGQVFLILIQRRPETRLLGTTSNSWIMSQGLLGYSHRTRPKPVVYLLRSHTRMACITEPGISVSKG